MRFTSKLDQRTFSSTLFFIIVLFLLFKIFWYFDDQLKKTNHLEMMKFNLKEFREKLNVEPPPGAPPKTNPGFSDVAVVKIGVKKMAFRGK